MPSRQGPSVFLFAPAGWHVDVRIPGTDVNQWRAVKTVGGVDAHDARGLVQIQQAHGGHGDGIGAYRRTQAEDAARPRHVAWTLDDDVAGSLMHPGEHDDVRVSGQRRKTRAIGRLDVQVGMQALRPHALARLGDVARAFRAALPGTAHMADEGTARPIRQRAGVERQSDFPRAHLFIIAGHVRPQRFSAITSALTSPFFFCRNL